MLEKGKVKNFKIGNTKFFASSNKGSYPFKKLVTDKNAKIYNVEDIGDEIKSILIIHNENKNNYLVTKPDFEDEISIVNLSERNIISGSVEKNGKKYTTYLPYEGDNAKVWDQLVNIANKNKEVFDYDLVLSMFDLD